jgi:hypothetical protein
MKMYVYIRSEPNLYTVGFYDPEGKWHPDSDWSDREDAAYRVSRLNGTTHELENRIKRLEENVEKMMTCLKELNGL